MGVAWGLRTMGVAWVLRGKSGARSLGTVGVAGCLRTMGVTWGLRAISAAGCLRTMGVTWGLRAISAARSLGTVGVAWGLRAVSSAGLLRAISSTRSLGTVRRARLLRAVLVATLLLSTVSTIAADTSTEATEVTSELLLAEARATLAEEANRASAFLSLRCFEVVANESEIHRLKKSVIMNVRSFTTLARLNILFRRRPIVVRHSSWDLCTKLRSVALGTDSKSCVDHVQSSSSLFSVDNSVDNITRNVSESSVTTDHGSWLSCKKVKINWEFSDWNIAEDAFNNGDFVVADL